MPTAWAVASSAAQICLPSGLIAICWVRLAMGIVSITVLVAVSITEMMSLLPPLAT